MTKNISTSLTKLKEGQDATVLSVTTDCCMRQRLFDLGLIEGTKVTCLHKSPSGDPIAFLIRGAAIALRTEDSQNILVSLC